MTEMPLSTVVIRQIFIPTVGGPLIETTDGDRIRLEYAPDFQPDLPAASTPRTMALAASLLTCIGFAAGWLSHAIVLT